MKEVHIKVTGANHELNYSVSPEVAADIVRQLNEAVSLTKDSQPNDTQLLSVSAKYRPLARYLSEQGSENLLLSFQKIEEVLGEELRPSARKHKAWWANSDHAQATAWLFVGYQTREVDLKGETVVFQKK